MHIANYCYLLIADVINTDGLMEELIVLSLVVQRLLKRAVR